MATNKTGLAFYNIDTDRYQDIRIKRLKKDFSCSGISVYDYILCEIYRVKGCFIVWDESTAFDVAEYFGIKESLVNEIVSYCGVVGLFNKELLTRGNILTSFSIQKRYIEMCIRAKRVCFDIPKNIKLQEECDIIQEESPILTEECDIIQEAKSTIVEKSRVEKSKVLIPLSGYESEFLMFWNLYDKKVGDKTKAKKAFEKLSDSDRETIFKTLPEFLETIKDKQFQPFPQTYLNQKRWNDDLKTLKNGKTSPNTTLQGSSSKVNGRSDFGGGYKVHSDVTL